MINMVNDKWSMTNGQFPNNGRENNADVSGVRMNRAQPGFLNLKAGPTRSQISFFTPLLKVRKAI